MCAREHVLQCLAGPDIPIRNAVIFHKSQLFIAEFLILTYYLHYLEGVCVIKTLGDEECHDIVSA